MVVVVLIILLLIAALQVVLIATFVAISSYSGCSYKYSCCVKASNVYENLLINKTAS